jgi:hypothetical protein
MLETLSPDDESGYEPAPRFASDAEIALADQLRRQLEERYFGRSAISATGPAHSDKNH